MNPSEEGLPQPHPASFRDADSTVFVAADLVVRAFRSGDAYGEATEGMNAPFAVDAVRRGAIVATSPLEQADLPPGFEEGFSSRRIPFAVDPREWSFEMRKDAALLTLDLSRSALTDGFEMKDASAFNVLFDGCQPTFVDHGSFRAGYSGHWPGYSQFGDHFMNPLLVESGAGVNALAAGFTVTGIPLGLATATNRGAGRFRRGSFSWLWRRSVAERMSRGAGSETGERLASTSLPREAVVRILEKARARIETLESSAPSIWRHYEESACPYDDEQTDLKRSLVDSWSAEIDQREVALDVGCNVGTFSQILAGHFERVIAVDNDSVAIDRLYRRSSGQEWGARVTPAVVDIAQPTPAIGWLNLERASFLQRLGVVDLSVWLAVLHHLTLTAGIPLPQILDLIARISRHAIIEHIAPEDQSVTTMTAGRRWAEVPDASAFESELDRRGFTLLRSEKTSPTRTLVLARCPR